MLNEGTIKSICNPKKVLPKGLAKEAPNFAITTEQARSLIQWVETADKGLCGWVVFKLFTGARTELVQKWKWNIVNWEEETVTIPRGQTKLKKADIRYEFEEIPNLKKWLKWAHQQDGVANDDQMIVPMSQPTVTGAKKIWMNENKEIFAYRDANGECDLRRKIEPRFTHRNMERSGFITHGAALSMIQGSGVTRETIARVAEDRGQLGKLCRSRVAINWPKDGCCGS